MTCIFFFSQVNRERTLKILSEMNIRVDHFFVKMVDSELFLPYSHFDIPDNKYVVVFPNSRIPTKKDIYFCITLAEIAYQENIDLVQFSYRTRFLKRRYERLPIYLFLRLTTMSVIRLLRTFELFFRFQFGNEAKSGSGAFKELEELRFRLFSGYFFDDTKGFIASSHLVDGIRSLESGSISGQRVLMAIARDSMYKVCTMYPQKSMRHL